MNHASRPDWRRWLTATRYPARKDGAITVALFVLPWVIALVLWLVWLHHDHLDAGTMAAVIFGFAALSAALPPAWLTWATFRNASRTGTPSAGQQSGTGGGPGDRDPGTTANAGAPTRRRWPR